MASGRARVLPLALFAVSVTMAATPGIGAAAPPPFAPAFTVLGHTGVVTVTSTDVLAPGQLRAGISALAATGSGGNRVDLLLNDDPNRDLGTTVRAAIALGLPGRIEAAVTVPYSNIETNNVSTDGLGDTTVSAKLHMSDQLNWRPATAVSATWIAETARGTGVSSVTTNGYLATVSTQLGLISGDWTWTIMAEVGGFWRDPGRSESDSSLVYGVAGVIPLLQTGLLEDSGELQLLAEVNGTSARTNVDHDADDVVSFAPGLRYLTERWGITATGVFSAYEQGDKASGSGGSVALHVAF
jgi:hypothetical protein